MPDLSQVDLTVPPPVWLCLLPAILMLSAALVVMIKEYWTEPSLLLSQTDVEEEEHDPSD